MAKESSLNRNKTKKKLEISRSKEEYNKQTMVNAVGFPYIESSKLCLMVEAKKIMTLSDFILNVC